MCSSDLFPSHDSFHDATTNLDISSVAPMMIMGILAAAKIAVRPMIEYHAADVERASAQKNIKNVMMNHPLF